MLRGATFTDQVFSTKDFTLMMKRMYGNNDGIILGCELSNTSSNISIAPGYFSACGYCTNISTIETIQVTKSCKLVYEIDLTKENTEKDFKQGYFKLIDIGTPVVKENLHTNGTKYQLEFAEITYNSGITHVKKLVGDLTDGLERKIKAVNRVPQLEDFEHEGDIVLRIF